MRTSGQLRREDEIFSARKILGLKLLELPGERVLLVLRDGERWTECAALQERGGRWSELKRLHGPGQARALDAQVVEGDVWLAWELNGYWPIEVSRCRIRELLDPKQSPLALQPVGHAALSGEQALRAVLPVAHHWHVAGPLSPNEWLFSPRFVPGDAPGTMIVNTSDGQAMLISPRGLQEESTRFALPHAGTPQASTDASSGRMVAFLSREEGLDAPFWTLRRYHGRSGPHSGALMVVENGKPENLSESLGLGPVSGFQLLQERGESWLFTLRDSAAGTKVSALQRDVSGWRVRGTLDIHKAVQMLDVTHDRQRGWLLFLVVEAQEKSSIVCRSWMIP